jgi:hypothetical protein
MCNQFFKCVEVVADERIERVPVLRSSGDLAAWSQKVRQDKSVLRSTWQENGWILEDDLERLLVFRESTI